MLMVGSKSMRQRKEGEVDFELTFDDHLLPSPSSSSFPSPCLPPFFRSHLEQTRPNPLLEPWTSFFFPSFRSSLLLALSIDQLASPPMEPSHVFTDFLACEVCWRDFNLQDQTQQIPFWITSCGHSLCDDHGVGQSTFLSNERELTSFGG